ncbi:Aste57867_11339 [Aphanomyces stellatus]|uniref:Aste57867_11339 protein n=1 Tax=Aphanomyces stellatus TaxID=120398 RepID=A0A485KTV7_9STRA|nr:hypothetical protein As57867_011297 [Aphanomyces stellatus]VFT88201.1 Aste57867_11339 [Aphanomyces stellatus]
MSYACPPLTKSTSGIATRAQLAAPPGGVAILHPAYVTSSPVTLVGKRRMGQRPPRSSMWASLWGESFVLRNAKTNDPVFKLHRGGIFSDTTLSDATSGATLAILRRPFLAFSHCQQVLTPLWKKHFEITPYVTWSGSDTLDCEVVDAVTGQRHHFDVQGKCISHALVITCDGSPVAEMWKPKDVRSNLYHVLVTPGVDLAFIVLLCTTLDAVTETASPEEEETHRRWSTVI